MKTHFMIGVALSVTVCAGAAGAASYNGSWPIKIAHAQFYDGNYCLILSGATSGGAELTGPLGDLYGDFEVHRGNLIAIVPLPTNGFNEGE